MMKGTGSAGLLVGVMLTQFVGSQLSSRQHRMRFAEEQAPGTVVANLPQMFNVRFNDLPGRYFEILGQRMKVGNKVVKSNGDWLKIDRFSGIISVKEPVDRETECGEDFELDCVIMLQTAMLPQSHFRLQNFEFLVADVNDHSPKFSPIVKNGVVQLNISEDIREQSTINIDRFMATDEDIGENAAIHYSLSRNNHFIVSEYKDDTGASHLELVVQTPVDYEDTPKFEMELTASDRGSPIKRSTQISIHVNVIDVNDNAPVFDEPIYDLHIRENAPRGHVIATVRATDLDEGVFGEVRYFVPQNGNSVTAQRFVNVEPISGEVTLRTSPDRETKKMVKVVIAAQDSPGLTNKKVGRTILLIHILDVNDNSPRIDVNIIIKGPDDAAYVSEGAEMGTYIAHVSAADADHGEAGNVMLSIESIQTLLNGSDRVAGGSRSDLSRDNYFILRDNLISTNRRLDRETEDKYLIRIRACDRGTPQKCSYKRLKVVLLDSNDHAPKFLSTNHAISLPEDMKVGSIVDSVIATDHDSVRTPALSMSKNGEFTNSRNGEVRFSLDGAGSVFAIDSITGSITLVGMLDYETKSSWRIVITAQDLGNPPKKSNLTITVKVTDVNDHRPVFIKPDKRNTTVYATILEDRTIIRIKTIDRDAGANADIWYSLASEDGSEKAQKFLIDPVTGSVRFNISNKLTDLLGDHTLVIKASDKGSPPMEETMPIVVRVINLPLSSVIPDYEEIDEGQSTKITAIILSSLAAATLILLVILVCIVIKCKKEDEDFKVYNFRAAEAGSRSGLSCASTINMRGTDEVGSVNTLPVVSSRRDVRHGRANARKEFSALPGRSEDSNERLKFTTFSRFENNSIDSYVIKRPPLPAGDGDSGRGDSDRESNSIGDKEKEQSVVGHRPCRYLTDLGPRCTSSCRNYGHSDECWMPEIRQSDRLSDAHEGQTSSRYNSNDRMTSRSSLMDTVSNTDPKGLETISETQPLSVVLDLDNPSAHTCRHQRDYPSLPRRTNIVPYVHGSRIYQPQQPSHPRHDIRYSELSLRSHYAPSTEIHSRRGSYSGSGSVNGSYTLLPIGGSGDYVPASTIMQNSNYSRPHSACPQLNYHPIDEMYSERDLVNGVAFRNYPVQSINEAAQPQRNRRDQSIGGGYGERTIGTSLTETKHLISDHSQYGAS